MSYQTYIGENVVAFAAFDLLKSHNSNNHKGAMAQLALIYKLVNSFPVHSESVASEDSDDLKALTKDQILRSVLPWTQHTKDDIRNVATKITIDVQRLTKSVTIADL